MDEKLYTAAFADYWNNHKIVEHFSRMGLSEYWREYLLTFRHPEKYHVLDLGCGGGRNTEMILTLGFRVTACDLHINMVQATRDRIEYLAGKDRANTQVVQAEMTDLPFADNAFDILLANGVYHNAGSITILDNALYESSRVLKNFGKLCINIFVNDIIDENLRPCGEHLYLTMDKIPMVLLPRDHLLHLLKKNGFRQEGELVLYKTVVQTGERFVMRGVFEKQSR